MIKDFWKYIQDWIIKVSEDYIDSNEYGIIVLPEGIHFIDVGFSKPKNDLSAFFEPIFVDIDDRYKLYEKVFDLPDISHIKGFLVFEIDSIKRNNVSGANISRSLGGISAINDIKYLIIHECRHAQQNRLLRNEFKQNRIVANIIDLDKNVKDLLEYDAHIFAVSKVVSNKYNKYKEFNFDKGFLSCIHYLYDKELGKD